jgi:hypothetical protein
MLVTEVLVLRQGKLKHFAHGPQKSTDLELRPQVGDYWLVATCQWRIVRNPTGIRKEPAIEDEAAAMSPRVRLDTGRSVTEG